MATFNNGESGSSVRAKLNAVLQHADGTTGELVINEAGADVDFRVESDTNANALFLDGASGNVGIGTSSPVANGGFGGLTLNGTTGSIFSLMANGTETGRLGGVTGETFLQSMGSGVLKFIRGAGGTESMRIAASGNVGIGTASPARPLDVNGTARLADGAALEWGGTTTRISGSSSSNTIILTTNNSERMRLDASGNLGLGVVPSAWTSGFTALEMSGVGAGLYSTSSADMNLISNAYHSSGWKYGATAPAALFQATSGAFKWNIAPSGTAGNAISFTQAMTLDASGNLGLGTTSITPVFGRTVSIYNAAAGGTIELGGSTITTRVYASEGAGAAGLGTTTNTAFQLITNNTERARIDASGNLLVGTTTRGSLASTNSFDLDVQDGAIYCTHASGTPSGYYYISFGYGASNVIGSIVQNGTTGVSYNTSSDYRLKEDLQPIADASSRLAALNPVNFAWKADGTRTDGFIAHEVQAVVPQAVTGEKDGEAMQAIDHSKLVPLLTAALQEALAEIASLKARLDAANL